MTFARWTSGEGEGRDPDRVVATLRRELLVPLHDDVAAAHLEAMLLERDFDRATDPMREPGPRSVGRPRPRVRARTFVGAGMLAAALSLTSGFAAAGALPATAQHWISRATRVIGIPLPDAPPRRPAPPRAPHNPSRQPSIPSAPTVAGSGAGPTPSPTNGTHRPGPVGVSGPLTGASTSAATPVHAAPVANVPKAHEPDVPTVPAGGNAETESDADNQSDDEGGQTAPKAPKAEKAEKKVAPKASKKADKKSGSAAADDDQGEDGNGAASVRGSGDH